VPNSENGFKSRHITWQYNVKRNRKLNVHVRRKREYGIGKVRHFILSLYSEILS